MQVLIDPGNDTIKDVKRKLGKNLAVPPKDFKLYPVGKEDTKPPKNTDKPRAGDVLSMVSPKSAISPHVLQDTC
jgi:hypothetical protein